MVEFKEWGRTQRHSIVMCTDFEELLKKFQKHKGANTLAFQKHNPMSYGLYVKAEDDIPIGTARTV